MACILFPSRRTNQQQLWLLIYYLVLGSTILASQSQEETGREHEHGEKHFEFVNVHSSSSSSSSYGEEKLMTLTERLINIDNIVNCAHETLCTSETAKTHRFFTDIPLGSHENFARLAREKINLVASFVQQLKSSEGIPRSSAADDQLVGGILEAIQSSPLVKQVRWVTYFQGSTNQTHWMYKLNLAAAAGSTSSGSRAEKKDVDAVILGRVWDLAVANTAVGRNQQLTTVLLNISDHDIQRFPWFFRPPTTSGTSIAIDTSKFDSASGAHNKSSSSSSSSSSNNNKNQRHYLRGPEFGFWTWPYFACSKISSTHNLNSNTNNNNNYNFNDNNTEHKDEEEEETETVDDHSGKESNNNHHEHSSNNGHRRNDIKVNANNNGSRKKGSNGKRCDPVQGLFVVSYTAGFPMYQSSRNKVYGIISFDVDLSSLYINQCDYASEEEMKKDMAENPLHVFRGTHKCDRNSSVCHFTPVEGEGWRQGSYVCRCHQSHYAAKPDWSNSVPGYTAEMAWWEWKTNLSEDNNMTHSKAAFYKETVTCNRCQLGCEDCYSGESCLAEIGWIFRITLLSVSMVSIACTAGMILIVYKYRRVPVLKSSSPTFHCIVLVGCIIMYCEMIALFPSLTMEACIAVKWTRHLGFCITYTALYMKLCRVYLTFRVKSAHKIKLTEKHLLHWMSPIMVIMLLYLCAWTLSSPPNTETIVTSENKRFVQCIYNWWDHALAAGEVIFLSYGVWICWRIRENPDAQFISYSIYNIAIINILMVALHLIIVPRAGPDAKYLFAFLRTQMSTSVTIALVFGSKLYCVLWGKPKELKEMPSSANGFGHDTLDLAEENQQLKEELQKLAGQMERLKCYAMGKNNPHLKQSSTNISSADLEFSNNRMETFTTL